MRDEVDRVGCQGLGISQEICVQKIGCDPRGMGTGVEERS
jgi:hypothetical protein